MLASRHQEAESSERMAERIVGVRGHDHGDGDGRHRLERFSGGGRDRSNAAGGGPAGNGGARTGAAAGRERDPYAILGLDRRADFEEIRKAYHRQANRYHPDKVAHLGQEFQDLAKVKFQDVQWAYETLAKQKGQA